MSLTHEILMPDGKRLHTLVCGQAGSGKTFFIERLLESAVSDPRFGPKHRFVLIDPKHEAFTKIRVPRRYSSLLDRAVARLKGERRTMRVRPRSSWSPSRFRSDRVVVIHPDIEALPDVVSEVVDELFRQSADPQFSATLVLDEAAVLIEPQRILPAIKRLATQGRSRRLRGVFASQRPLSNRWLDGQVSDFILFSLGLPQDSEMLKKRWGVDLDEFRGPLSYRQHSWLRVRFTAGGPFMDLMAPVAGRGE